MTPLVSILIPAFNAQQWISDTLRSAIAQTWPRKEIIIVDDGSTDQTLSIVRQFESTEVSVVTQSNRGSAAARNTALSQCHGDYVQWLDADDLLSPDKIARQMEIAQACKSRKTLLSCAWGRFMYRYYRAEIIPSLLWCDLSPVEWLLRKVGQNLFMPPATWLVSRELTEAAGTWDESLVVDDDGEYFCRVLLASDGVRFVPTATVYYRASGSGGVSYIGRSGMKLDAQWRSMVLHIGYLRSLEDSGRVRAACVTFLQNWLMYFYPERHDIVEHAQHLANYLGGRLEIPRLSWKYSWIQSVFGWRLAKRAQSGLPLVKWRFIKFCDRVAFRMGNQPLPEDLRGR